MTIFSTMNKLLKSPDASIENGRLRSAQSFEFLAGAILCYAAYAAAAGTFQAGGASIALAILKIPMIIIASVALCVPSFYVFTAVAGADHSARDMATLLSAFCGIAGLLLLGLMPVTWVFSISSRSLAFVVWMHIVVWLIAIVAARHYLVRLTGSRFGLAIGCWITIVFLVSLQMTTSLRPVLWRAPNQPLFTRAKMSFFEHIGEVWTWHESKATAQVVKGAPR
ncbi:MAG TPA: hypothetical protein VNN08_22075 [Thermoanaerobaculia bacterium]|nr:hypothetical protein [Thermoanaerobaculia bacterium]